MNEVIIIAGMFVVTFGVRYVMFAMAGKIAFPNWFKEALAYVPPVVLSAIIAPLILMPQGDIDISINNAYFWAAITAALVGFWRQHLLTTISIGMLCFVIIKWINN